MVKEMAYQVELQRLKRNSSKLKQSLAKVAHEGENDEITLSSNEEGNVVVNNRFRRERVEELSDDEKEASLSGEDSDETSTGDEDKISHSHSISEEEREKNTAAEKKLSEEDRRRTEKHLMQIKSSKEFSQNVNEQSLLPPSNDSVDENKTNIPDSDPQESSFSSPAVTFESLGVIPQICQACTLVNWHTPTQIQKEAIPHALLGRDIIGLAETGSGKTGESVDLIITTIKIVKIQVSTVTFLFLVAMEQTNMK
jgi:hypothetical protein